MSVAPARRLSFELLCRIAREGLFCDEAIHSADVALLQPRDRGLLTEMIMGTLRWQGRLDHALARASNRPWSGVDARIQVLLRMSLYQMWHLNRIPDHAIVNDAVELAKSTAGRGAAGFLNGILRALARSRPWEEPAYVKSCAPWIQVSLPHWLWKRWRRRFGRERAFEYALSLNETPALAFHASPALGVPPPAMASDLVPGAYTVPGGETEGSYLQTLSGRIQDEASQLIPHLLGNILGWKIWDVCAAPGGKSAILREKCGGSGMVVSTDSSLSRAKKILSVVPGTTDSGAAVAVADARYSPPFLKSFDAVLADVPCSGLGTLRRNPDIKWRFKPERLLILQQLQQSILNSVSTLVRPGGFLLYSTCSVEPEENENVVCAFLAGNPEFALIRPEHPPGVEALLDERGFLRTYPGTRLWDGFFAALMERASTFQGRFRSV